MSSLSIDYSRLLSLDLPIVPYDVTFLISNEEKEKLGEVQGHKFIFALNSPVFRIKFCGAGDFADQNNKEDVEVFGTLEAFQLMSNFLYNKPTAIDELSVDEIFDVVILAHYYDVAKLEEALEQRLETIIIATEDVMEAAKKAEKFARFQMASQALLKNCARTLREVFTDAEAVIEFSSQFAGTGDEAVCLRLFAEIRNLCSNCRQSPCISGAEITSITQVRVGTRVILNPDYYGEGYSYETVDYSVEVVSIDAREDTVKVKWGEGTNTSDDRPVTTSYGHDFCFAC